MKSNKKENKSQRSNKEKIQIELKERKKVSKPEIVEDSSETDQSVDFEVKIDHEDSI